MKHVVLMICAMYSKGIKCRINSFWRNINNVDDQLAATITDLLVVPISSTCFGQLFAHPREHWLSQCLRSQAIRPSTTWVHYTTSCKRQSSAPEDGQKVSRNMLSWLELVSINLLLHLVGYLHYLYQWCTVKQTSNFLLKILIYKLLVVKTTFLKYGQI